MDVHLYISTTPTEKHIRKSRDVPKHHLVGEWTYDLKENTFSLSKNFNKYLLIDKYDNLHVN